MSSPEKKHQSSWNPFRNEFIPLDCLANLKKYKYSGADFSIMSRYVLQHYWNFVVSLVPLTVAPNCITFTGFCIGMSSTVVLLYYYFMENAVYPDWTWYYAAFTLFVYQTLDAIDGKQARRTGTGSPLGELFDHGCDAFLTPFVMLNMGLCVDLPPQLMFWFLVLSCFGLFTAIWEQFSTGIFDLGYLNGPTEGILLNCCIFIITGLFSQELWTAPRVGPYSITLPPSLSWLTLLNHGKSTIQLDTLRSLMFVFFLLSCSMTILTNISHVLTRPSVHARKGTAWVAALPTIATTALLLQCFFVFPDVTSRYPLAFELTFGLLMSITVTRLTIARLCAMPYNSLHCLSVCVVVTLSTALLCHFLGAAFISTETVQVWLGRAMTGFSVLAAFLYGHMILSIFTQVARYLKISIMSISPRKKDL